MENHFAMETEHNMIMHTSVKHCTNSVGSKQMHIAWKYQERVQ